MSDCNIYLDTVLDNHHPKQRLLSSKCVMTAHKEWYNQWVKQIDTAFYYLICKKTQQSHKKQLTIMLIATGIVIRLFL